MLGKISHWNYYKYLLKRTMLTLAASQGKARTLIYIKVNYEATVFFHFWFSTVLHFSKIDNSNNCIWKKNNHVLTKKPNVRTCKKCYNNENWHSEKKHAKPIDSDKSFWQVWTSNHTNFCLLIAVWRASQGEGLLTSFCNGRPLSSNANLPTAHLGSSKPALHPFFFFMLDSFNDHLKDERVNSSPHPHEEHTLHAHLLPWVFSNFFPEPEGKARFWAPPGSKQNLPPPPQLGEAHNLYLFMCQ